MNETSQGRAAADLEPSRPVAMPRPETIGLAGLWTFGFLGLQDHRGLILGVLLMGIAAVLDGRAFFARTLRTPAFLVFALLATYVALRAMFAAVELPETIRDQVVYGAKMVLPLVATPLVAWWLGGQPRRLAVLLALAIIGLCIEFLVNVDWNRLGPMLTGQRGEILASGLSAALYAGLALLAWTIGLPTALRWLGHHGRLRRYLLGGITATALIVLLAALLITNSRAVIGMLLVLLPTILLWHFWRHRRTGTATTRSYKIGFIVACLVLVIGGTALGERVSGRFALGAATIQRLVTGNIEQTDRASGSGITLRVDAIILGMEIASSRPILGWGPGTSATGDLQARFETGAPLRLEHLHNAYLEIWVRLGAAGFLLYLLAFMLSARPAIQSARTGRMPPEAAAFLLSSVLLIAGWCLINYRLTNPSFSFWLTVILGIAHTFALQPARIASAPERAPSA